MVLNSSGISHSSPCSYLNLWDLLVVLMSKAGDLASTPGIYSKLFFPERSCVNIFVSRVGDSFFSKVTNSSLRWGMDGGEVIW